MRTSAIYHEIYDYICLYKTENDGCAPSVYEIGDAVGISSSSMVNRYLNRMVSRGMIERGGKKGRMILIPGARWFAPSHMATKITVKELARQDAKKLLKVVLHR